MHSVSTYDGMNLIQHLCETRNFVMAILHWKQGLLCDKDIHQELKMCILYFDYG